MSMSELKPFIRVSILSCLLALALIALGIKYHWGDYLKEKPQASAELKLPIPSDSDNDANTKGSALADQTEVIEGGFSPEIVESTQNESVLDSMTKEQINAACLDLLGNQISDPLMLELASVNCVMSNYEETYQETPERTQSTQQALKNKALIKQQCQSQVDSYSHSSPIHRELLIGICVSDKVNTASQ